MRIFARPLLDAERHANRFTGDGAGVVLRFGQFYAADSSHTLAIVGMARHGISPFLGPRHAFAPLIHADDVASAVVGALDVPAGTYNVVDDEPLTQGELASVLAAAVGLERLRFAPVALCRLGGAKVRMLMRSQRVSNRRFRLATQWEPRFPTARQGLPIVVDEIGRRENE